MITKTEDITAAFNASNDVTIDVGGFDFVILQLVSPTGTVNFRAAISDAGGSTLFGNGSAASAEDFYTVQGVNLATGTAVTSVNASAAVRFSIVGKFLNFNKSSVTATNAYIQYIKAA